MISYATEPSTCTQLLLEYAIFSPARASRARLVPSVPTGCPPQPAGRQASGPGPPEASQARPGPLSRPLSPPQRPQQHYGSQRGPVGPGRALAGLLAASSGVQLQLRGCSGQVHAGVDQAGPGVDPKGLSKISTPKVTTDPGVDQVGTRRGWSRSSESPPLALDALPRLVRPHTPLSPSLNLQQGAETATGICSCNGVLQLQRGAAAATGAATATVRPLTPVFLPLQGS
jgi:hypothetical protein